MFLILSRHLCLGPSQNYALKTIMSIICLKKVLLHHSSIVLSQKRSQTCRQQLLFPTCLSICPSEWNSWAPAGRSFVKFYDGLRIVRHVEKIQAWLSRQKQHAFYLETHRLLQLLALTWFPSIAMCNDKLLRLVLSKWLLVAAASKWKNVMYICKFLLSRSSTAR